MAATEKLICSFLQSIRAKNIARCGCSLSGSRVFFHRSGFACLWFFLAHFFFYVIFWFKNHVWRFFVHIFSQHLFLTCREEVKSESQGGLKGDLGRSFSVVIFWPKSGPRATKTQILPVFEFCIRHSLKKYSVRECRVTTLVVGGDGCRAKVPLH